MRVLVQLVRFRFSSFPISNWLIVPVFSERYAILLLPVKFTGTMLLNRSRHLHVSRFFIDITVYWAKHIKYNLLRTKYRVYGQNGDKPKRRQTKTATPKRRQTRTATSLSCNNQNSDVTSRRQRGWLKMQDLENGKPDHKQGILAV